MKSITLEQLKDIEKEEYESLKFINEEKLDHQRAGEEIKVKSCEDSARFQHGRWSMICDLIEELEAENE